jgi:hypothetical protein
MKSFKEYLTESKKVYEFKLIMCGDLPANAQSAIKAALAQYDVTSVSAGRRKPIAEMQQEFPEHKNVEVTFFDVVTNYPANAPQVRDLVASSLGIPLATIKAKTLGEWKEWDINHEHDERTHDALVGTYQDPSDHSELASEKQKLSFIKELEGQPRTTGKQYSGYNDDILAKSAPSAAAEYKSHKDVKVEKGTHSPIAKRPIDPVGKMLGAMK